MEIIGLLPGLAKVAIYFILVSLYRNNIKSSGKAGKGWQE